VPDRPLEIRWLKRALANLDAEAAFIALDNPSAAARVVDTITRTVEMLAEHPGLGRPTLFTANTGKSRCFRA